MGMDLLGEHGDERFNAFGWRECLERAVEFGWTPDGTVAPIDFPGEWKGGYCSNDYQMVTGRDARALGEALLRAVAALKEIDFGVEQFAAELNCLRRLAN
jgi:hypothetical protein